MCAILAFARCAQVAPLTGGPRDINPPKLLEANPANASTGFTARVIELKFDEFVKVKDAANQVVITPGMKEMPDIEANGKKVLVKFKEDLKPNTTYRIFFGNAITDMHEGNILNNFEYVFSTGSIIDSLWISGRIVNAFNLQPANNVMVGLYGSSEQDSVVFKQKPLYFTKSVDNGIYRISYLPKSSFKIFAYDDKNKNLVYDGGEEMIGFRDTLVETQRDTIVNLKVFQELPAKTYIKKAYSPVYGTAYVIYNKALPNEATAAEKNKANNVYSVKEENDTCIVYYHDIYDTLKLHVKHAQARETDTIQIPVPSKEKFEKQIADKRVKMTIEIPDESGKIPYYKMPVLRFNGWLDTTAIDAGRIKLYSKTDTLVRKQPLLKVKSANELTITSKLQPETVYNLLMEKGAFKSKAGAENDSINISFTTSSPEDYAVLNAKLLFPAKENYIVQLINDKQQLNAVQYVQLSITSSEEQLLVFKNVLPGNYFLKIIEDKNQNEQWDTGSLMQKLQPEKIYFDAQSIKIPAGWDSEIEWKVN